MDTDLLTIGLCCASLKPICASLLPHTRDMSIDVYTHFILISLHWYVVIIIYTFWYKIWINNAINRLYLFVASVCCGCHFIHVSLLCWSLSDFVLSEDFLHFRRYISWKLWPANPFTNSLTIFVASAQVCLPSVLLLCVCWDYWQHWSHPDPFVSLLLFWPTFKHQRFSRFVLNSGLRWQIQIVQIRKDIIQLYMSYKYNASFGFRNCQYMDSHFFHV